MRTVRRLGAVTWAIVGGAFLSLTLGVGCGPGEAKAPNPTLPLDERRAIEVIRRAIKNEGAEPVTGRDEILSSGKALHIDVGVQGHAYGVSYITTEDTDALGTGIPSANKKDEKLRLVRAGADGETHVVLLFQQNYVYDDLTGEAHEQTTVTAENALARDVQDFITYARTQKFK
jgi:hypothetical protein